ncbi:SMC family ATPase [Nocardioides korecus]
MVLRFTVGTRTFRITRSPAWDRPRRRGEGTRRIQAHVVAEELRDQQWHALTTRLDEVGHLVVDLLGMTCAQFTQVVLLPQGRFQAFLRAGSSERHAVLQRLFRTSRYEDVERWLVDRRLDLSRRSRTHLDRCADVVSRVTEVSGARAPAGGDGTDTTGVPVDLEARVADGALSTWARGLQDRAGLAERDSAADLERADADLAARLHDLETATTRERDRGRGAAAHAVLADLDRTCEEARARAAGLERHRRAVTLVPAAARADRARVAVVATRHEVDDRLAELAGRAASLGAPDLPGDLDHARSSSPHPVGSDTEVIDRWHRRTVEDLAVARSWLPREEEVRAEEQRALALEHQVVTARGRLTRTGERAEELRALLASASAEVDDLEVVAAGLVADREALAGAVAGLTAARRARSLRAEVTELRRQLSEATTRSQDLRERWLDLREQRVSGMAGELASSLVVGCSCPVCGSAEHPSPATSGSQVGRVEEDAAREQHEAADFERQAVQEMVTTRGAELTQAEADAAGRPVAAWAAAHEQAARACERTTSAARDLPRHRTRLGALREEERSVGEDLGTGRTVLAERQREHADSRGRAERLRAGLTELLGPDSEVRTVADLVRCRATLLDLLDRARAAVSEHDRARREELTCRESLVQDAREVGFADVEEALSAVLPAAESDARRDEAERRRDAEVASRGVLEDPAVVAALEAPGADLDALTALTAEATRARDESQVRHRRAVDRSRRLTELGTELDRVLAAWEPVRAEHEVVAGLAALVEGKSADNQWRMRLSAYVLGERLRQVVAAANERLVGMTDQRYTLEQEDEKGAGERRGGLSLRVLDEWSGTRRDPATLSGGETFVVSLALALGLADTVSHEAGGTQLDTLFIDEGFGTLDAATLDHVMDTLDTLRDGGRVVGLVSHVAELRTRVTSQLEVRKGRSGSTVRLALARG